MKAMKNLHLANTFYGFVFNCKQCYSAYASNVVGKKCSNIRNTREGAQGSLPRMKSALENVPKLGFW